MTPDEIRRQVNEATDSILATVGAVMENDSARLAVVENEIKHLRSQLDEVLSELRNVRTTMSEARGGWKAVALIGGISATFGAMITKLLPFILGMPK